MADTVAFDTTVDQDWRAFRIDLADRITALKVGDEMIVGDPAEPWPSPRLRFTYTRARKLRCAVDCNSLPPTSVEQRHHFVDQGWRPLGKSDRSMIFEVGRLRVDALAAAATDALREIWSVQHPALLSNENGQTPQLAEPAALLGAAPQSTDQLRDLVVGGLQRASGQPIYVDPDGDIPVPTHGARSWLRICSSDPAIEFFGCVVDYVPDTAAAAQFVAGFGSQWPAVTLQLVERQIFAFLRVPTTVFHPENLMAALHSWSEFIDVDVARLRGELMTYQTPATAADEEPGDLPEALQALLEVDPHGEGIPPERVISMCGYNRADILRYIRICSEQVIEWRTAERTAMEDGDAEESAACRQERKSWQRTMGDLREALRSLTHARGDTRNRMRDRR